MLHWPERSCRWPGQEGGWQARQESARADAVRGTLQGALPTL